MIVHLRAGHVHIVHFSTILASLKQEDLEIGILRQAACNDGTACSTTEDDG